MPRPSHQELRWDRGVLARRQRPVWRHWLDPAGIGGGAGPRASFAEAFFFSVQTLGSIGFGVLHPVSF